MSHSISLTPVSALLTHLTPYISDQLCLSIHHPHHPSLPRGSARPIEIPLGLWTRVGPRKHALDGDAHWCNLANTTEPSMCGGDAAFLSNYYDQWFFLMALRGI